MTKHLHIAKNLQIELREKIQKKTEEKYARGEVLEVLLKKFATRVKRQCRNGKNLLHESSCGCRCNDRYWNEHGDITKALMEEFAKITKESVEIYGLAGKIHDLDYLMYPHDLEIGRGNQKLSGCHPLPLVKFLISLNVDPEISLAILEHAPHLKLENTTRLSIALSACEELATLISFNNEIVLRGISDLAKKISCNVTPKVIVDSQIDGEPRVFSSVEERINKPLMYAFEFIKDSKLN
ncbi:hypothetical protein A5320_19930 [Rheinheimera sp. SA_1]|uniref:hypothetical protein n=1 Tax=Rheinheimera sp. SA_1 TaxID=1827365 RepID=UPI0007FC7F51|nr:hypothetical protein [Rheinheimera sp. SA_1]OBP13119.1 hypothetical protein A5320_19930 [Rheinheimera sp. SA_1]